MYRDHLLKKRAKIRGQGVSGVLVTKFCKFGDVSCKFVTRCGVIQRVCCADKVAS